MLIKQVYGGKQVKTFLKKRSFMKKKWMASDLNLWEIFKQIILEIVKTIKLYVIERLA